MSSSLEKMAQEAKQRLASPGIEAWGLRVSDGVLNRVGGEVIEIRPATGCTTSNCAHVSHDPAAPTRRWIPPVNASLVQLGGENLDWGTREWYAVRSDAGSVLLQLYAPFYHWAYLYVVDNAPDWVLGVATR